MRATQFVIREVVKSSVSDPVWELYRVRRVGMWRKEERTLLGTFHSRDLALRGLAAEAHYPKVVKEWEFDAGGDRINFAWL